MFSNGKVLDQLRMSQASKGHRENNWDLCPNSEMLTQSHLGGAASAL